MHTSAHGLFGANSASVAFSDGQLVERAVDRSEVIWGEVPAWAPSVWFVIVWHPGGDASEAELGGFGRAPIASVMLSNYPLTLHSTMPQCWGLPGDSASERHCLRKSGLSGYRCVGRVHRCTCQPISNSCATFGAEVLLHQKASRVLERTRSAATLRVVSDNAARPRATLVG